jgi:dienelactone hydrolase
VLCTAVLLTWSTTGCSEQPAHEPTPEAADDDDDDDDADDSETGDDARTDGGSKVGTDSGSKNTDAGAVKNTDAGALKNPDGGALKTPDGGQKPSDAQVAANNDADLPNDMAPSCTGAGNISCGAGCAGTALYTPCAQPLVPMAVPAPSADECIKSVTASDKVVFNCDGYDFTTSIPKACVGMACGLIFDVHGLTQNADIEDQATEFAKLGRDNGYIVVQPTAPSGSWAESDRAPLWSFLERVMRVFHVDPHRVHFAGYSQGGDLTWWALCDHSDVLASVAPNNMPNMTGPFVNSQCFNSGAMTGPKQQLPVLYAYGKSEPFASAAQYQASVDAMKKVYDLTGDGEVVATGTDQKFEVKGYTNANGVRFEYMAHDYSGAFGEHCVAGSGNGSTSCAAPMDIHWGKYMMKFFIDHPRP